MLKISDAGKIKKYICQYEINQVFDEEMRAAMELVFYKKNEYILRQDEKPQYLYLFIEGKAKVFMTLSNGRSLLLCFYKEFKVLGDLELMHEQNTSANVQAMEGTYCIRLPLDKVKRNLLGDVKFLNLLCNALGEKLLRCSKNSTINLLYPVENRLASYIFAASQKMGEQEKRIFMFDESLTVIAELLGTSYRHLLRTLKHLCQKNIIVKKKDYYEISDARQLELLAADIY